MLKGNFTYAQDPPLLFQCPRLYMNVPLASQSWRDSDFNNVPGLMQTLAIVWQHVKLSDVSLGTHLGYSLVIDEDVKKPTKQTNIGDHGFPFFLSSGLLMSSLLGHSFLVLKLFRLSVYFVRCFPLLLVPQIRGRQCTKYTNIMVILVLKASEKMTWVLYFVLKIFAFWSCLRLLEKAKVVGRKSLSWSFSLIKSNSPHCNLPFFFDKLHKHDDFLCGQWWLNKNW